MAEALPYNLDAARADGFVDYYELLQMPSSSSSEELRGRIQGLYSEAQANRDHRNLNKRRDYQSLLEYLPQARGVLVEDEAKRQSYDEYAAQARTGAAPQPFETFLAHLSGEVPDEERTDVLGVQSGGARTQPKTSRSAATAPANEDRPVRRPQVQSSTQQGLMGSAIAVIVFAALLVICFLVTSRLPLSVLIAAVGGIIAWFALRPRGGGRISR